MGLEPELEKNPKKQRLSGPRVKRSREEVFEDERERLHAKFEELMQSMSDPAAQMPTAAACAKQLRAIETKTNETRLAGLFECVASVESLSKNCGLVKEGLRVANQYLHLRAHPCRLVAEVYIARANVRSSIGCIEY